MGRGEGLYGCVGVPALGVCEHCEGPEGVVWAVVVTWGACGAEVWWCDWTDWCHGGDGAASEVDST